MNNNDTDENVVHEEQENTEQQIENITGKDNTNIFSIISLIVFLLGFFVGTNFVMVLLVLILSFILSVIGIVESNKIKAKSGVRKGFIISLTVLVLSVIMLFVGPAVRLVKHTQEYNSRVYLSDLSEKEKAAYDGLQELYYRQGDVTGKKANVEVDSIYCKQEENEEGTHYIIYINYNDKKNSKQGEQLCYEYTSTNKAFIDNKFMDSWVVLGDKIDENRIIQAHNTHFRR